MRRGILSVVAAAVTVIGLAGCVGPQPLPTLPPSPSSTPIFASEEEALAAAEDAYAAYSEVSDLISAEGGADPDRIAPYVTEEQLEIEIETAAYYSSNGVRAVGRPATVKFDLQQFDERAGLAEIVVYVCIDVSSVRVVDASGRDVTPEREPVVPLEVVLTGNSRDALLVASSEVWPGSSFC